MTRLLQIVPRLPPAVDGLGDYAVVLAEGLQTRGVSSRFLVTDRQWTASPMGPSADVLNDTSREGLLRALGDEQQVLLHFVNYAYEPRRGCPYWMLDALRHWREGQPQRRLVIMFHELFAMGWPWRKAFWYSPEQRAISAALARLADHCWTSNHEYGSWLDRQRGGTTPLAPVLSNLGEPTDCGTWDARERAIVVFGRAVNRQRAYHTLANDLVALARTHGLTHVHDVGSPLANVTALPGLTTTQHGLLPAAELSRLLLRCRVGVIHNDGSPLAKSGVAAAYAAHGVVIACEAGQRASDGLVPGHNLLVLDGDLGAPLDQLAHHAHAWYHRHDRDHQCELVAAWFPSLAHAA